MRARILLLCLVSLLWTSEAHAGLPQAGKVYQGPKSFSSAPDGLAFKLPKGWAGGLDGEFFGIVDPQDQGKNGILLLWSTKGTLAEARKTMASNIPVSGVVLKPKTKVTGGKKELKATYSVLGGGALTEATVTARVAHGTIVAVIAAYSTSGKKKVAGLNRSVLASLKISKPKALSTAGSNAGSDSWQKFLTGARLTRFSTGSGYSEKESYTFCPNGTFYRSFNAGSNSVNGTGAAQGNNSGRWKATGKGNSGTIILHFADDSVDRSAVEYRDNKTYWGGTRYFYEANKCN